VHPIQIWEDRISLIELLLNILTNLTRVRLDINNTLPLDNLLFNLEYNNWIILLNRYTDFIKNSIPEFNDNIVRIVQILHTANTIAIVTPTGEILLTMTPNNRDNVIQQIDQLINLIREVLESIHPHYMDQLDAVFPNRRD